ncbi:hypothetical protein HPP92_016033 [Vanilla planifolia]|uniref:EF-hand domain-containing protein n=1 Tax=Vanilla planifolia TaxID=51239 RepID=A0A835URN7_VANPL|nr:hypothetical protein HPP92_016033 [Vanilla planifolia]
MFLSIGRGSQVLGLVLEKPIPVPTICSISIMCAACIVAHTCHGQGYANLQEVLFPLLERDYCENMSEEEMAGLKEMFKMIDTDNSGQITFEELKDGLQRVGANLKESEISALMEAADIDNSGTIDYGEFIAATLHLNKVEREDNLFAAFQYFDKDGSGYITQDELQNACEEFGMVDIRLEELIREVDQNNDGRIDYNEFVAMMHHGNVGLGIKGQQNKLSFGLREALKLG